jgi:LacI family transcriptional regulator
MEQSDAEKIIRQPKAKTSLKELAEHLGLSQTTVSRVVNRSGGSARIPAQTCDRVLTAAAKFNYKPNALARSLRSKHSQIVSVIVPEISDGYSASVLSGIEDGLLLGGYFYFVVSHRHRPELLREYPSLLISRAVEGIIAVDSAIEDDLSVPLVNISGHSRHPSAVNIELDHLLAAHYALEHLKRLGHTRIAIIKGQSFSSDTQPRWRAICKVASEIGITIHPRLTVQLEETGLGLEPGRVATTKLIERGESFSAIFAFNDHTAMGAIMALHEAGLTVPGQVSVVGFDDIPGAAIHNPPLTTVRQPLHEMGRVAATELLQMVRNGTRNEVSRTIRILPTFIERESTAVAAHVRKSMEPILLRQVHP